MPGIMCNAYDCIYEKNGFCCYGLDVQISDLECQNFIDYKTTEKYQNEYYIRIEIKKPEQSPTGKKLQAKVKRKGICIDRYGHKFFTDEKYNESYSPLTESKSGIGVGSFENLTKNLPLFVSRFKEAIQNLPPLEEIPEVYLDYYEQKYKFVQAKEEVADE